MSLKNYFEKAESVNALSTVSAEEIGSQVESVGYHEQDIIKEKRFIPRIDFSKPENFAHYGSAEEYYQTAMQRMWGTFPYDGSRQERLEWENTSTYIDLYIYDNLYPRTNGYIILSAEGWGTGNKADGYGSSSLPEYILFWGGPHANPNGLDPNSTKFTGSNYYEPNRNRETNLKYDLQNNGASVEFWLKKDEFITSLTDKEVIFDMWNGALSSSTRYGRLRIELSGNAAGGANPFNVTLLSGASGIYAQSVATSSFTTASVADGLWHHYGFTFMSASGGIHTRFYVDGNLNNEGTYGTEGINEVTGALRAYIGALVAAPHGGYVAPSTPGLPHGGKLSASLDEFRYWKTHRSSQDIGRYWFSQVGGGTNDDPTPFVETTEDVNTLLGVYYKFNEGITGRASVDRTVLDYSGRVTNGAWRGYTLSSRNTGSAIVISSAAIKEYKDPIIYNFHPAVVALSSSLQISGSDHDAANNASMYNSIPQWIREEDIEGQRNLKFLTQIMSSYFDDFQLQARAVVDLKNIQYPSGSQKPLPFAAHLLNSYGFVAPDIFLDADIFNKLADRSETQLYEKTLTDIKNTIYQNIYNNLVYIYKTKGTEKSFRNLIRCFGIDDELVKINLYASNVESELRSNRKNVSVPDKLVNFNTGENQTATVVQYQNPLDTVNTTGSISASTNMANGYAFTLESDIFFPEKFEESAFTYEETNTIQASLFGVHGSADTTALSGGWTANDVVNFQVYALRDELQSDNVTFMLTGTAGGVVPLLTSSLIEDVYTDTNWNLSVRVKPERYPLTNTDGAVTGDYTIELHGINVDAGVVVHEFTVTGTIDTRQTAFVTGSKRVFLGAHRTNYTGTVQQTSDVKINSCRFWLDYLEDGALAAHAYDTENVGTTTPHYYAFPFNTSASYGEITRVDTLVFNWEFSQNTGSNTLGQFDVIDESSGSNAVASSNFGWIGEIVNKQYSARGFDFAASSTTPIDKDYVIASRQTLPENIYSKDMVKVLNEAEQQIFTMDSRPLNYYFAFEKSLYQTISEEIINYFATLKDLNTIIGAPVNRYRHEYKALKFLRQRFFAKVANEEIDFDKFFEFYKWFDSSLTMMLNQLVPASTDFAKNVRTIIESHVLERNKYQSKFPFLEDKTNPLFGSTWGTGNDATAMASPEDFPAGTGFFANTAYTRRQIGSSNPIRTKEWSHLHSPPTQLQREKSYWWKLEANRAQNPTLKAGTADSTNYVRQELLLAIRKSRNIAANSPVRFGTEGSVVFGGVGFHPNKRTDFVYDATAPAGRLVEGTNIPVNVMLSFQKDVEELIDTTDVYYPSLKQRLGFWINPDINRGTTTNRMDGNVLAPFSLYSSSVKTGYNNQVIHQYHSGVMITNQHHDIVHTRDIPLQGPFTEKYVGGRQHRHIPLNRYNASLSTKNNLDSRDTRPEAWMIKLGLCEQSAPGAIGPYAVGLGSGALGIVGPQYPDGTSPSGSAPKGYLFHRPKANLARGEYAKRPVNIRNIRMTTGSTIIGNYEKNYQVVQTCGRELNDPFFNDQSFDFAPYPETLATRGRFPLGPSTAPPWEAKSILFSGGTQYAITNTVTAGDWDTEIGGAGALAKAFSVSMWINPTTLTNLDWLWQVGGTTFGAAGRMIAASAGNKLLARCGPSTTNARSDALSIGVWQHIVFTFPGNILTDGGAWYINGVDATDTSAMGNPPETISGTPMRIAGIGANGFDGYLCDVAVWNKELSLAEVANIWNLGSRLRLTDSLAAANLISWWKLGNGADSIPGTLSDETGFAPATPTNMVAGDIVDVSPPADSDLMPPNPYNTANPGGALNYAIPARTGSDSQQTVFVNRFAGSGYEVMSLGYMDPAHEELSVYNALPYHNLSILNYGISGSASVDPSLERTIRVIDQIDKNRGLDQRATLHCGQFGHDAAYGSVSADTYVTLPSWHKTNRNAKKRIVSGSSGYATASVFDNLYVQHQIPRSTQQYSWIAASIKSGSTIFGLESPSCAEATSLDMLISESQVYSVATNVPGWRFWGTRIHSAIWTSFLGPTTGIPTDFVGLNTIVVDPSDISTHTLGYPSMSLAYSAPVYKSNYINSTINYGTAPGVGFGVSGHSPGESTGPGGILNSILLNRNGPYGYPSWKQIRTGEHPVARKLRETNKIGVLLPPPLIPKVSHTYSGSTLVSSGQRGFVRGLKSNRFVDYTERPVTSHNKPIYFAFQDNTANSDPSNNIALRVSYGNKLEYFTHEGLNNRLNLGKPVDDGNSYNTIANFAKQSSLSVVANYSQRIYPAAENVYNPDIRSRTEFSIKDIWDKTRNVRSVLGGLPGAGGQTVPSSSIWPLDGHNNFTTSASVITNPFGGPGELMNFYSRYSSSYPGGAGQTCPGITCFQLAAPTYAWRVTAGSASSGAGTEKHFVLAGDAEWQAVSQSGKQPYLDYKTYAENIRLVGKDYSLIPEFRISEHMETFVRNDESNFLKHIRNIFEITGAVVSSSAQNTFYKVYSNTDFLKYFSVVDDDLNEARSGDLTITRDKLTLKCNALLNFLPYKGFYPAERTVELARLFRQSFSSSLQGRYRNIDNSQSGSMGFRMLLEPLYSPGIMFNTIKSGIGVGSTILCNTASDGDYGPFVGYSTIKVPDLDGASINTNLPEGVVTYHSMINLQASSSDNMGFTVQKVPFEALYQPRRFFNAQNLRNISDPSGKRQGYNGIFDMAATGSVTYGNPDSLRPNPIRPGKQPNVQIDTLDGDRLYELAIDNFLCETTNMFVDNLTNFQSNREEDFLPVVSGTTYTMRLAMYRPGYDESAFIFEADRNIFDMYTRKSAFGAPLNGQSSGTVKNLSGDAYASFSHLTPPYFDYSGSVLFSYTAQYDGLPDLNDILGNMTMDYSRVEFGRGEPGPWKPAQNSLSNFDPRMMVDSCFNLTDIYNQVPDESSTQKRRWLIQSKFETPVFNFVGVNYSAPPVSFVGAPLLAPMSESAAALITRGLWHQYGNIPTGSGGVFTTLLDDGKNSLAQIVGMPVGRPQLLGKVKKEFKLEEAVIAVPFRITQNRRDFMSFSEDQKNTHTYKTLVKLMDKYVFPPRFDFTRFDTVEPIIMYAMEFSLDLNQEDIGDIWQNVAPSLLGQFQQTEAVVEEKELVDIFAENSEEVRWMVFKVKKRAQKDYERFRRSLVTPLTGAISVKVPEKFSYNWPYDYCSLVELAKIEETYQWASRDIRSEDPVVIVAQGPTTTGPPAAPSPPDGFPSNPNQQPDLVRPPETPLLRRAEADPPNPVRRRRRRR